MTEIRREDLEQQRLWELNRLADLRARFVDDGKCLYCGIRARIKNLCVICEQRRDELAAKYQGSTPVTHAQTQVSEGMTKLGQAMPPRFRTPHNSE